MSDIASLGLSVDSKPVEQATQALNKFAASGKTAEAAAKGFEAGAAKVGAATEKMSKQMVSAINSAAAINQRLNVRDTFGGAADSAAFFGAEMDNLRAKFNPLFAAERAHKQQLDEINKANRVGAITERERADAVRMAEVAYQRTTQVMKANAAALNVTGKQAALSSYAMTNLAFQINDVATMAAMGADPMRILASQAGQFYQILSTGEGGVRGSLGYLKDMITGMITPLRLAGAGFVGLGVAAGVALKSAIDDVNSLNVALAGIGRASGTTVQDINNIATAAAAAGNLSVSAAREMATAFAATGRINAEVSEELVNLGRNIAKTFGETTTEAAARMARAFSDPAVGVVELNKRLGAYDDRTVQLVRNLTAQNRITEAQKVLLDGIKTSIVGNTEATSQLERGWQKVGDAVSDYWQKAKDATRIAFGGASPEEELVERQEQLARAIEGNKRAWFDFQRTMNQPGIDRLNDRIKELNTQLSNTAAEAEKVAGAMESIKIGDIARGMFPGRTELQNWENTLKRLNAGLDNPNVTAGMSSQSVELAEKARQSLEQRVGYYKTSLQLAQEENAFAVKTAYARSAAQRADIEYQQTLSRLLRDGDTDAGAKAALQRQRILEEANAENLKYLRDRQLSDDLNLERSQMEVRLVGQTGVAAAGVRAEFDAIAEAKRRANELGGVVTADDLDRAKRLRAEAEATTAAYVAAQMKNDLLFERAQMGRSDREQNVYGRLQSAGLLTDGQIVGAQAEMIAQQIRFNEVMRISQDSSKEFASSWVRGMMDGKSATEALADSLNRLAQRFADMAMDQAFSALFSPMSSGIAAGATGDTGWLATILHDGGEVGKKAPQRLVPERLFAGAKRYHQGAVIGPDEVPAILQKGEEVIPRGGRRGAGAVTVKIDNHINAQGAYPESIAQIQAALAAQQASLPQQIVQGVRDSMERGLV